MPTPDGIPPRLLMGLDTRGTSTVFDDLDSDYDGQSVIHEYGHGLTNRLAGARTSTSCLVNIQSGAMDEGWADDFAISRQLQHARNIRCYRKLSQSHRPDLWNCYLYI